MHQHNQKQRMRRNSQIPTKIQSKWHFTGNPLHSHMLMQTHDKITMHNSPERLSTQRALLCQDALKNGSTLTKLSLPSKRYNDERTKKSLSPSKIAPMISPRFNLHSIKSINSIPSFESTVEQSKVIMAHQLLNRYYIKGNTANKNCALEANIPSTLSNNTKDLQVSGETSNPNIVSLQVDQTKITPIHSRPSNYSLLKSNIIKKICIKKIQNKKLSLADEDITKASVKDVSEKVCQQPLSTRNNTLKKYSTQLTTLPITSRKPTLSIIYFNPLTPQQALTTHNINLTTFEKVEILQYSQIYYVGLITQKIAVDHSLQNNGFDDKYD